MDTLISMSRVCAFLVLVRQVSILEILRSQIKGSPHDLEVRLIGHTALDVFERPVEVGGIDRNLVLLRPLFITLQETLLGQRPHAHVLFHHPCRQHFPLFAIRTAFAEELLANEIGHDLGADRILHSDFFHSFRRGKNENRRKKHYWYDKQLPVDIFIVTGRLTLFLCHV